MRLKGREKIIKLRETPTTGTLLSSTAHFFQRYPCNNIQFIYREHKKMSFHSLSSEDHVFQNRKHLKASHVLWKQKRAKRIEYFLKDISPPEANQINDS